MAACDAAAHSAAGRGIGLAVGVAECRRRLAVVLQSAVGNPAPQLLQKRAVATLGWPQLVQKLPLAGEANATGGRGAEDWPGALKVDGAL